MKFTFDNGRLSIETGRQRVLKRQVPLPVLERYKELSDQLANGVITQAQGDDLFNTYVRPYIKLPDDYDPVRDVVRLSVKRAPSVILSVK
jgi:hypothetical protein